MNRQDPNQLTKSTSAIINQAHLVRQTPNPGMAGASQPTQRIFVGSPPIIWAFLIQELCAMPVARFVLNKGIERLLHEWDILSARVATRRARTKTTHKASSDNLRDAEARLQSYCARWHSPIQVQGPYFQISNSPSCTLKSSTRSSLDLMHQSSRHFYSAYRL